MLLIVSRLLLLAPVLTFGLGAAFVLSAYRLGAFPADPAAWQAFLTLAPMIRESVYFISGLPGLGDASAFAVFSFAALVGCVLVLWPTNTGRLAFIYAHLAFVTLFYSMSGAGVFTAGDGSEPTGLAWRLDWTVDFSGFPTVGVILFVLVAVSCASAHLRVLSHLKARVGAGRANPPGEFG